MIVDPFYFFLQVRQSLKRQALPGSLLASSSSILEKKKKALNIAGFFEHTQCADGNGYVQDDAVFEFLTNDDV